MPAVTGSVGRTATAAGLLHQLAVRLSEVHIDTLQHTEAYYFHDASDQTTLAVQAAYAQELARAGQQSTHADVQHGGTVLATALEDLIGALDAQYLHTGADADTVLRAHRRDQRPAG